MNTYKRYASPALSAIALATVLSLSAFADTTPVVSADNSKVNQRDRNDAALTAGQQSSAKPDIEITREIRKSLMSNDKLSTYAHNVKIITQDGAVTLKGPVRTPEEKTVIERAAVQVAGATHVTDQLEVVSN